MEVAFPNEGVSFTENKPDFHIFTAIVKKKDGKGDMVPIMAPDSFNAAIMAGLFGELLYIASAVEILGKLKEKLYGPDLGNAPSDGFEGLQH